MDWYLIISLITLALLIVSLIWGTGLWVCREKLKIKSEPPIYKINTRDYTNKKFLKVYWGGEFQRLGGKEMRYIKQILLKPDEQMYSKLQQNFYLPENREIEIKQQLELPRDKIVSSAYGGIPVYPEYEALPGIQDSGQWDTAQKIALELSQREYKVRLVWEDGGKTKWIAISKEHYGEWVRI